MVFKCQEDSFLKEFTTKVLSCDPSNFDATIDGSRKNVDGFEVVCEDTILFPEGGGQPSDQGFLNDKLVHKVVRRGDTAVLYVTDVFQIGEEVKQVVNWKKRFDNMQQHSGQHLVSAVLERELKFNTVSWWLGEEDSYIELDTPVITEGQMQKMEDTLNELIREGRNVKVQVFADKNGMEEAHTRGLPADHIGDVRVIVIDGVDSNMCCGTHVSNLSQLQLIKILYAEKSKRKNQLLLHFLVGNRALRRLDVMLKREQKLTSLLNNSPTEHYNLVEKQMKGLKMLNKNFQNVLKEIAIFEANKLKALEPRPSYFVFHKKEAEPDFMNTFIKEMGTTDVLLFLSVGDEKGLGNIVLYGSDNIVGDLSDKICTLLSGKGAGKGNKFQAKVTNMANKSIAEKLVQEYFSVHPNIV